MKTPLNYLREKKVPRAEKVQYVITFLIRLSLLFALFGSIVNFRWIVLFVTLLTFFLTFLPQYFEKKYKIYIPAEFEIIIVLFIYATLFLGEVQGYYARFAWWDALLHGGSALAFGFIGFILMYVLYRGKRIESSPVLISLFAFSFAVAIGAVWEVFEFAMDSFFGLNMQKSGLVDTMWDLIIDIAGAAIASALGFIYLKTGESFFFDRLVKGFEKDNPKLFK